MQIRVCVTSARFGPFFWRDDARVAHIDGAERRMKVSFVILLLLA